MSTHWSRTIAVTLLYNSVISDGNWAEAERVLQLTADSDAGLFDTYAHMRHPRMPHGRVSAARVQRRSSASTSAAAGLHDVH
jgi:hypothetical protein